MSRGVPCQNNQIHAQLSVRSEVTKDHASNIGSIAEIQGTAGNDKISDRGLLQER